MGSWTHGRDPRYSRATSAFDRPSNLTAATTNRANDIAHPLDLRCKRCRETGVHYVLKPDTAGGTIVMSRDIVYTCLGTSLHVGERLGLVVAGGVQGEVPERFSVLGE